MAKGQSLPFKPMRKRRFHAESGACGFDLTRDPAYKRRTNQRGQTRAAIYHVVLRGYLYDGHAWSCDVRADARRDFHILWPRFAVL